MRNYEYTKAEQLKRNPMLMVLWLLGIIVWEIENGEYNRPFVRRLHPLTWVYALLLFLYGIVMQGFPETLADMKTSIREEMR